MHRLQGPRQVGRETRLALLLTGSERATELQVPRADILNLHHRQHTAEMELSIDVFDTLVKPIAGMHDSEPWGQLGWISDQP